jgi:uncharacterized membrane protein (DUF485 family)
MSKSADTDSKPTFSKNYTAVAASKPFKHLLAVKKTFIIPAFLIFLAYYFALAVLIGYEPKLASTRVIGTVTIAYLLALSQFVVGWVIAALYLLAASKFDALTADILAQKLPPNDDRQGSR